MIVTFQYGDYNLLSVEAHAWRRLPILYVLTKLNPIQDTQNEYLCQE